MSFGVGEMGSRWVPSAKQELDTLAGRSGHRFGKGYMEVVRVTEQQ